MSKSSRCILFKSKTPSRAALHPRGRQNFLVPRRLCRKWAGAYVQAPVASPTPHAGLKHRPIRGWCQEPDPFPVVVASRPPTPCEDYNYKSLAAVAHTPGWNVTPVAGCGGSLLHTGALDVNALVGYVCMGVRKSVVDGRGVPEWTRMCLRAYLCLRMPRRTQRLALLVWLLRPASLVEQI